MKVISLGWGVQSWTMAAMVALGELPSVDLAIHSDTGWERQSTYAFRKKWEPWLAERGVKVVTVVNPEGIINNSGGVIIPAYTLSEENNIRGQLRRQCTKDWKITPMRHYIAEELKRRNMSKEPGIVELWLGITKDEWQRAKDSDVKYIKYRYPLLEMGYSRADCLAWLEKNDLPSPGKSSCTFCPYHSRKAWEEMKREGGADWQQAVEADAVIRYRRPPYPLFVHPDCKPLAEAVRIPEDYGAKQIDMFELLESNDRDAECDSGHCFL